MKIQGLNGAFLTLESMQSNLQLYQCPANTLKKKLHVTFPYRSNSMCSHNPIIYYIALYIVCVQSCRGYLGDCPRKCPVLWLASQLSTVCMLMHATVYFNDLYLTSMTQNSYRGSGQFFYMQDVNVLTPKGVDRGMISTYQLDTVQEVST